MSEQELKHLEFIQNVITRMNSNSFSIKGWMITIVSAFLALYASSKNIDYILFTIPIVIIFWLLDSYYLLQERKFRGLYNDRVGLTINPKELKLFEMNPSLYTKTDDKKYSYFNVFKSITQWSLYLTIILGLIGFYSYNKIYVNYKKGDKSMARKVFFSFKYDDVSRAMVVRNSWVVQGKEAAGFIDKADFEQVKKKGDKSIQTWIDNQLKGTSVTVVLVGEKTCNSKWVKYEIDASIKKGNGILAIDISKIKDLKGNQSKRCGWMIPKDYKTYLWNKDDGYNNMGDWIEEVAQEVGK